MKTDWFDLLCFIIANCRILAIRAGHCIFNHSASYFLWFWWLGRKFRGIILVNRTMAFILSAIKYVLTFVGQYSPTKWVHLYSHVTVVLDFYLSHPIRKKPHFNSVESVFASLALFFSTPSHLLPVPGGNRCRGHFSGGTWKFSQWDSLSCLRTLI